MAAKDPTLILTRLPQFSTRVRVERLRERLAVERDPTARKTIKAQLAAFERPPRGTHD